VNICYTDVYLFFYIKERGIIMLLTLQEKGQGLVEYALILVLIALVVIFTVELFGTTLDSTFDMIVNRINEVSP